MQDKNNPQGLRVHKHIFVGNSRLVTAMTHTDNNGDNDEQREKRYYYHSDHLGSAQFVTDWRGKQYEHIEYTPYGELWIEEVAAGLDKLPFRFTGKEMDEETGLYYYGARYLDPKYSRWLSEDPALSDYIPKAPIDDEAKKHNENLPGMGGVFNVVNLHLYHYAGNNPVKYTDPDGRELMPIKNNRVNYAVLKLFFNSPTFKKHMNNLLASTNAHGDKLLTVITAMQGKYAGNTETQTTSLDADVATIKLDRNGSMINGKMNKGDTAQAIVINIDLDRIDKNGLNLLEVIAEEVVHGSDASKAGAEKWEKRAIEENKLPYKERPREISAKNVVKEILKEMNFAGE